MSVSVKRNFERMESWEVLHSMKYIWIIVLDKSYHCLETEEMERIVGVASLSGWKRASFVKIIWRTSLGSESKVETEKWQISATMCGPTTGSTFPPYWLEFIFLWLRPPFCFFFVWTFGNYFLFLFFTIFLFYYQKRFSCLLFAFFFCFDISSFVFIVLLLFFDFFFFFPFWFLFPGSFFLFFVLTFSFCYFSFHFFFFISFPFLFFPFYFSLFIFFFSFFFY